MALNPVRVELTEVPEASEYTSFKGCAKGARQFPFENRSVKEECGTEWLILRRGRHISCNREMREECLDLGFPHLFWMALTTKEDKSSYPIDVRLFSADTVAPKPDRGPDTIEQTWLLAHCESPFLC